MWRWHLFVVPRILLGLCLVASVLATPCSANELDASSEAPRLVVHGPDETLSTWCDRDSLGRLWLELPGGSRFELVTSTNDPAIWNPGDGSFHPFDVAEVNATIAALRFPSTAIRADIFLLPYPRREGLESAAGPGLVLLAPGVRPLSREQQHAELVHELGHVVHHALMPDTDVEGWAAYRRLRGITDESIYSETALHSDRPHEIFAEDFRALFGDPLATYSGTIENATLTPPEQVAGLADFMRALAGVPAATVGRARPPLLASPNPSRGVVRFSRAGLAVPLDLYDVHGRRIAVVAPEPGPSGMVQWSWDRRLAGTDAAPSIVYARPRDGSGAVARVTLMP